MAHGGESAKTYSLEDVALHNERDDMWIVICDKVYNISKFLDEHPGGEEVLIEQAGKNATESFEDVGHSSDARDMMKDFEIGELIDEDKKNVKIRTSKLSWGTAGPSDSSFSGWLIPIGIAFVASLVYRYYIQHS